MLSLIKLLWAPKTVTIFNLNFLLIRLLLKLNNLSSCLPVLSDAQFRKSISWFRMLSSSSTAWIEVLRLRISKQLFCVSASCLRWSRLEEARFMWLCAARDLPTNWLHLLKQRKSPKNLSTKQSLQVIFDQGCHELTVRIVDLRRTWMELFSEFFAGNSFYWNSIVIDTGV